MGPYQSSFLPGRGSTCDNVIVLQEVLHSMHKSKKKNGDVAIKIDFEKAYDNVSWPFLEHCLQEVLWVSPSDYYPHHALCFYL